MTTVASRRAPLPVHLFAALALAGCDAESADPFATVRPGADTLDAHFGTSDDDVAAVPDFSGLVLNEVAPAGDPDDWFELYNRGSVIIDLGGVGFTDTPDEPFKSTFPAGTRLAPGAYLVQVVSDTTVGWKLGGDEALALFAPSGAALDAADWDEGAAPAGSTWGRIPNGTGAFRTTLATPVAANVAQEGPDPEDATGDTSIAPEVVASDTSAPPDTAVTSDGGGTDTAAPQDTTGGDEVGPSPTVDVVLNEIVSSGDDAIELLNRGPDDAALDGWSVADADWIDGDATTDSHRYTLPAGTTLAPGARLVLRKGTDHDFGIGGADAITLRDAAGALVDTTTWTEGEADVSWCRDPDGVGAFGTCAAATIGAANEGVVTPSIDVVLNEIVSSGDDAIELLNRGAHTAGLDGWSVADADWVDGDASTDSHRYTLPAGTTLAPGARLVLRKGTAHGFGIGGADAITLRDAAGALVDTTTWTEGEADVSWCRDPDGVGAFGTCAAATIGAANGVIVATRVLVDELCYDEDGTDGPGVFTELWGPPGLALDGWALVGMNGADGASYRRVPLDGAVIPADGRLVVARSNAAGPVLAARDLIGDVDWQNGPDAVLLLDADDVVVDALQYGDEPGFAAGEGDPADDVAAGSCLARTAHGDSADNAADFGAAQPTPGY